MKAAIGNVIKEIGHASQPPVLKPNLHIPEKYFMHACDSGIGEANIDIELLSRDVDEIIKNAPVTVAAKDYRPVDVKYAKVLDFCQYEESSYPNNIRLFFTADIMKVEPYIRKTKSFVSYMDRDVLGFRLDGKGKVYVIIDKSSENEDRT